VAYAHQVSQVDRLRPQTSFEGAGGPDAPPPAAPPAGAGKRLPVIRG
jgi:hypothetical protein